MKRVNLMVCVCVCVVYIKHLNKNKYDQSVVISPHEVVKENASKTQ